MEELSGSDGLANLTVRDHLLYYRGTVRYDTRSHSMYHPYFVRFMGPGLLGNESSNDIFPPAKRGGRGDYDRKKQSARGQELNPIVLATLPPTKPTSYSSNKPHVLQPSMQHTSCYRKLHWACN